MAEKCMDKNPPHQCQRLIDNYKKVEVVPSKGGNTRFKAKNIFNFSLEGNRIAIHFLWNK